MLLDETLGGAPRTILAVVHQVHMCKFPTQISSIPLGVAIFFYIWLVCVKADFAGVISQVHSTEISRMCHGYLQVVRKVWRRLFFLPIRLIYKSPWTLKKRVYFNNRE